MQYFQFNVGNAYMIPSLMGIGITEPQPPSIMTGEILLQSHLVSEKLQNLTVNTKKIRGNERDPQMCNFSEASLRLQPF